MNGICSINIRTDRLYEFAELITAIKDIFNEKIMELEPLTGGISNQSFYAVLESGKKLVLRLPGMGYEDVVDRQREKHNCNLAASFGISPEVYYFNGETGSEIIEFLELPTMHIEDFQNRTEVLERAGKLLAELHNRKEKFSGTFSPIEGIEKYESIMHKHNYFEEYEGWDEISAAIERIRKIYEKNPPELVPCHCDTLAENFMFDGETMKIIDWEFGGMSDPYYDASGVLTENHLDEEASKIFFRAFCGKEPTEEQTARLYVCRFLYCTYWSHWALAMIAKGRGRSFNWPYGEERAQLGLSYLHDPRFEGYLKVLENL